MTERLPPPPRGFHIFLRGYDLPVDIGFHDFEVGVAQRLLISVDLWIEAQFFAASDDPEAAWNYDVLRREIGALATGRRWNLQETLVRAIYEAIGAKPGVVALTVSACKPDVYPDCAGVGVTLSSLPPG